LCFKECEDTTDEDYKKRLRDFSGCFNFSCFVKSQSHAFSEIYGYYKKKSGPTLGKALKVVI